jgi:gluconate 2-dehydrogenase subunit 3-like protein
VSFTRRFFIKSTIIASLSAFSSLFSQQVKSASIISERELSALRGYINLLIPTDETPGALELGADRLILQKAKIDPLYAKGITKGSAWLNLTAQALKHDRFIDLPQATQLKIIAFSEKRPIATLPHYLHHTLRDDVFNYYYSHPEVIEHFRYAGPPQPIGFPDFANAPQRQVR